MRQFTGGEDAANAVVQIVDSRFTEPSNESTTFEVIILMELAACDLQGFMHQ